MQSLAVHRVQLCNYDEHTSAGMACDARAYLCSIIDTTSAYTVVCARCINALYDLRLPSPLKSCCAVVAVCSDVVCHCKVNGARAQAFAQLALHALQIPCCSTGSALVR
eukprot:13206-Heterococcus_DN1.PRE.15